MKIVQFTSLLGSLLVILIVRLVHGNEGNDRKETSHKSKIRQDKRFLRQTEISFESFLPELEALSPSNASSKVVEKMTEMLQKRITDLYSHAKSGQCREKIAKHFSFFVNSIGNETVDGSPFSQFYLKNSCPDVTHLQRKTKVDWNREMTKSWQPPRDEAEYIDNYKDMVLLYGILMHGDVNGTLRLIQTLDQTDEYKNKNLFVVHVDAKEESDEAYLRLLNFAKSRANVHLVPNKHRIRVNWGGFSMVNATMQILKYSFGLLENEHEENGTDTRLPLFFHKFVHLSSTHYPIKSNSEIRQRISQYPIEANFMEIIMKPNTPSLSHWHYFVECDDMVHRIHRLPPLTYRNNGVQLYTGSQWFIISKDFAEYIAKEIDQVPEFIEYFTHVVVADEHFFSTILRNSPYCTKHVNRNWNYFHFDRWENEVSHEERDRRKCLFPDPDRCGRSPTIMTSGDFFALEFSDDLFARKFDDEYDSKIKDLLDEYREKDEASRRDVAFGKSVGGQTTIQTDFAGQGVLIVVKETVGSHNPLCLGLDKDPRIKLVSCFRPEVVPTLSKEWETGAVIEEEVKQNIRWRIGPCSKDGSLLWSHNTAQMISTGNYFSSGPHCMLKIYGGIFDDKCLDNSLGLSVEVGSQLTLNRCTSRWHQSFAFGNGILAPNGSIHTTVPSHVLQTNRQKEVESITELCLGVANRGNFPLEPWKDKTLLQSMSPKLIEKLGVVNKTMFVPFDNSGAGLLQPLELWEGKIVTTVPCFDEDAIIKFVFVPFIVEDKEIHTVLDTTVMTKETEL